tara:strand:+ start:4075 stop:4182 length:108 start_codon:yes stop_codon:yes gene_type:complete
MVVKNDPVDMALDILKIAAIAIIGYIVIKALLGVA